MGGIVHPFVRFGHNGHAKKRLVPPINLVGYLDPVRRAPPLPLYHGVLMVIVRGESTRFSHIFQYDHILGRVSEALLHFLNGIPCAAPPNPEHSEYDYRPSKLLHKHLLKTQIPGNASCPKTRILKDIKSPFMWSGYHQREGHISRLRLSYKDTPVASACQGTCPRTDGVAILYRHCRSNGTMPVRGWTLGWVSVRLTTPSIAAGGENWG